MKHSRKIALVLLGSVAMTSVTACNEDKKSEQQSAVSEQSEQGQHNSGSNWMMPAFIGYMIGNWMGNRSSNNYSSFRDEEERRRDVQPVINPSVSQPVQPGRSTTSVAPPTSQTTQPGTVSRGGFGGTANEMSNAGS